MIFRQLFLLFTFLIYSIQLLAQTTNPIAGSVKIDGRFVGGSVQQVYLINQTKGGPEAPLASAKLDENGNFEINADIDFRDYYVLQLENNQFYNLILEPNDHITITAYAFDILGSAYVLGSENTVMMNTFISQYQRFNQIEDSLKGVLRKDPTKQVEVNEYFAPMAQSFYAYRNNYISANQYSPALIAVLTAMDQEKEWEGYKQIIDLLNMSFGDSPTVENLQKFVAQKDEQMQQQILANKAREEMFEKGKPAKEIALPNPEGEILKLSDLRGKVVLVDFWASWCGPCRKENPNVVKAYHKYNQDGFEVYSVSLDQEGRGGRKKWLAAIEKDGLVWPNHVSSLEGFSTGAARDYMVQSIPFTVLIDQEGNIIATNVRGMQLEAYLKQIFGH